MAFQDFDEAPVERTCTRKKAYPHEAAARSSIASIKRVSPTAEVRAYACRRCGQWHVGGIPYQERRYDLQVHVEVDEWDAEMARRRSHGARFGRGGRGNLYSHRLSRQPRRERRDREERFK